MAISCSRASDLHGQCARASAINVTTALLLAAGTGTRLQPLTLDAPKCLTEVGGIPILERLVNNLRVQGFKRLVVVIGHLGERIQEFLQQYAGDMRVDYVINPDYRTTNNIYSLWLAREQIREPFLLVESDLVFEPWMLDDILQPDKMAISNIRPWMNGTTVRLGSAPGLKRHVTAFCKGGDICSDARQYKTVNLYSLSLNSWSKIAERLSHHVSEGRLGEYYEVVFAEMVADGTLSFEAVFFDADRWYEIDTRVDLRAAENLFARPRSIASRSPSHSLGITEPVVTVA
ncbi:MAG: phosphocholine cytidylyltransferase family protein [Gammaproteobacteria bacterium]|nr:phosphocholine cytidylyltransferase family protein [Gammaproteobacteria bacterium]